jgi:transposase-like protein
VKKLTDKFLIIKNNQMAARMIRKMQWKDHLSCPHCGCINDILKHSVLKNGIFRYFCLNCSKYFNDLNGTIFEKTKVPLWKWLYGLTLLLEATGSISAAELSRNIQVSYPTAWKMLKKIREAQINKQFGLKFSGIIESDEAWISHGKNQQILLGLVERAGKVQFFCIEDRKEDQLIAPHLWYVKPGSMVCTDSHASYNGLFPRFIHHTVNHSIGEFKRNHIWTNTIEGVWSMLKGILRTIHHGVSKKYLKSYYSLFAFNYNHRNLSISQKFSLLLKSSCQPLACLY